MDLLVNLFHRISPFALMRSGADALVLHPMARAQSFASFSQSLFVLHTTICHAVNDPISAEIADSCATLIFEELTEFT